MSAEREQSFAVDIQGLLTALTEQFPEPLLCVRELIQNAADAGALSIEVDVAFDQRKKLFRLAVRDDGRGMNEKEVQGYLTIGFSEKNADRDRGRFGIGKLSPYALGISRMIVETSDGKLGHRIVFNADGSGSLTPVSPAPPRGTAVRVYKLCEREEAENLAERTRGLVEERCGSIGIPLYVNGTKVNREMGLSTPYAIRFSTAEGDGVLGIAADPTRVLMGGGIVLEKDAEILGPEISYMLDSPKLSPTLSRNAVRRDNAFDALLRATRAEMASFVAHVGAELRVRVERSRQKGEAVERVLDPNDRAAMEWLRQQLLRPDDDPPDDSVRSAPVLETVDGGLVSAEELIEVIRREGRVPASRVPRTREEVGAYADRGVPVLLLYRDLEDFLERQGIPTVEVDEQDGGIEVAETHWSAGEFALARRPPPMTGRGIGLRIMFVATAVTALAVAVGLGTGAPEPPRAEAFAMVAPPYLESDVPSPMLVPDRPFRREASLAALHPIRRNEPQAFLILVASVLAIMSAAIGLGLLFVALRRRQTRTSRWLVAEAGAPLTVGEVGARRFDVLRRAMFHPIDFFVARGWSLKAAGDRGLAGSASIRGYRELVPEPPIRSGVRLDLDRIEIGFVDLVSSVGEPHDGRILIRRGERVLLNRNHPTVSDMIRIAALEPARARVLLDIMLATDSDLAKGTDPRQVEWDLLGRAEAAIRRRS